MKRETDIESLVDAIRTSTKTENLRYPIYSLMQPYFNALIEYTANGLSSDERSLTWNEQSGTLYRLMDIGRRFAKWFIGGHYEYDEYGEYTGDIVYVNEATPGNFKEELLEIVPSIVKYTQNRGIKSRHIEPHIGDMETFGRALSAIPIDVDRRVGPDIIVCIASGGFEPSLTAAAVFDKDVKDVVPVRFSNRRWNDTEVRIPSLATKKHYLEERVKKRNILVVDDFLATGSVARKVLEFLGEMEPQSLLFTAAKTIGDYKDLLEGGFSAQHETLRYYRYKIIVNDYI